MSNQNSLWDNPYINAAREKMPKEELDKYAEIGKSMYSIDFENIGNGNSDMPVFMQDAVLYVFETLKSGMHPSMLNEDERNIMKEAFGVEWYKIFKYINEDLTDIVTINPDLEISLEEAFNMCKSLKL